MTFNKDMSDAIDIYKIIEDKDKEIKELKQAIRYLANRLLAHESKRDAFNGLLVVKRIMEEGGKSGMES